MANKGMTRKQKEAVAILSAGTFLEYFDLMLYVHMAVLLNKLFFPQGDPEVAKLFSAFAFCSTFILRPIGGFIIGWIGDKWGRKFTVFLTTFIMACTCVIMANIGTYAEIGITASIVMIVCRMAQGFSSLGEVIGAELYVAEILKPPYRYVCNGIMDTSARLGGLVALIIASFATSIAFNWRLAFWFGAIIAVVGLAVRTRLRETPDFVDYKRRMKVKAELNKQSASTIKNSVIIEEKVDKKAIVAYFFIGFTIPAFFYITFIYLNHFMEESLKVTAIQIINQNLKVLAFTILLMLIQYTL